MKQDQDVAAAASLSGDSSNSKSMSMSTDWTDEKHSLYLDSMEISFVHQLYTNNFTQNKDQSKPAFSSSSSSKPFGRQFKVLRDGHWGRIDFHGYNNLERLPEEEDDGAALLLMNPWIRHFRSARRTAQSISSSATARKGKAEEAFSSSCIATNYNIVNTEEMTDQNFVDEDNEEMVKAKRIRTWAIAAPRKDKTETRN